MSGGGGFLLVRVDDRLLHGQVAFGWGSALAPKTYLLVDRRLAGRPFEASLYAASAPDGAAVLVLSPDDFLRRDREGFRWAGPVLLIRSAGALRELADGGFLPERVNLGGLHAREGAAEVLPYLFLSDPDWDDLDAVAATGVSLFAQDVPTRPAVPWDRLRARRPPRT